MLPPHRYSTVITRTSRKFSFLEIAYSMHGSVAIQAQPLLMMTQLRHVTPVIVTYQNILVIGAPPFLLLYNCVYNVLLLSVWSSSDLKGECSDAASKWYCNTLFYEAFPKALNLGRSGWTIENWITAIKGGDPVITKLAEMAYHDQIIIELGANNIPNSKQDASDILASMLELISLLRITFPHCKLKLLSILPRDYPRQYRELKEKTVAAN